MQVLPFVDQPDDEPFWVSREAFAAHFDQDDFILMRDVKAVAPVYRRDWFPRIDGTEMFQIAVVTIIGSQTQFINGRHRTAVLLPYLKELPIALATRLLTPAQRAQRAAIPKRRLDLRIPIELPDLPILD
jgi:hypothetical protein